MTIPASLMPQGLEALGELLDRVAERQRQDFGQVLIGSEAARGNGGERTHTE